LPEPAYQREKQENFLVKKNLSPVYQFTATLNQKINTVLQVRSSGKDKTSAMMAVSYTIHCNVTLVREKNL
jgi:hypothetical protein